MFKFLKNEIGVSSPVVKEMPAAAATYNVGDALALDASGYVAKATGTTAPTYIAFGAGTLEAGEILAVHPVEAGDIYETTFSADGSALKAGAKVTIATNGAQVTATTSGGIATLLGNGVASGKAIEVKF